MHSAGPELTKLAYTRLEDSLIRHRSDRLMYNASVCGGCGGFPSNTLVDGQSVNPPAKAPLDITYQF